jgi:hypothetical protein
MVDEVEIERMATEYESHGFFDRANHSPSVALPRLILKKPNEGNGRGQEHHEDSVTRTRAESMISESSRWWTPDSDTISRNA